MLFNKINSRKFRAGKVSMICLIIASYSLTFNSCTTTRNFYYETPYPTLSDSTAEITKIELKNGEIVDCEDKIVKIEKEADSSNSIVVKSFTAGIDYKPVWSEKRIPVNDILRISMEKSGANSTGTAFLITGIAIVTLIAVFIIGLSQTKFSPY